MRRSLGWDEHYAVTTGASASKHKFSDSRSSLSSYGSSHSRISSVTTVSIASSIATLTEMPLLEAKWARSPEPRLMPTLGEEQPPALPGLHQRQDSADLAAADSGWSTERVRPSSPSNTILNMRNSTVRGRNGPQTGSRYVHYWSLHFLRDF